MNDTMTHAHALAPVAHASADSLFDAHGRCIPGNLAAPAHSRTRRYFSLVQPELNHANIHARLSLHLDIGRISPDEFTRRAQVILQQLESDPQTRLITDGVHVPFMLPQANYADYGSALDETYLPAVQHAFKARLPQYDFVNHHPGNLANKLSVVPGTRHEQLLQAMRDGPLVGYFFPCLTEYSVPAAIERVSVLPPQFLLAGGFDTSAALIGSPDLLLRTSGYPPLLWLAALQGEKPQAGNHFEAYGYNLTFNRRVHFGQAAESWASGLVVLG